MGSRSSSQTDAKSTAEVDPELEQNANAWQIAERLHNELALFPRELARLIGEYGADTQLRWSRLTAQPGTIRVTAGGERVEAVVDGGWVRAVATCPIDIAARRFAVRIDSNPRNFRFVFAVVPRPLSSVWRAAS